MRLLAGHDATVAAFVGARAPMEPPEWRPGYVAFGVIRNDGALVAGVVFHDWHEAFKRVELSAATIERRVFSPQILRALGDYVFGQREVFRIWSRTSTTNRQARIFLRGIGFTPESTEAHWYGKNKHAIQYRMIEPEWRVRWGYTSLKEAA